MSTREQAHWIVDTLNEEQLKGFLALFSTFVTFSVSEEKSEKEKAYDELRQMIHPIPHLDYDKELAAYREEKYGK